MEVDQFVDILSFCFASKRSYRMVFFDGEGEDDFFKILGLPMFCTIATARFFFFANFSEGL